MMAEMATYKIEVVVKAAKSNIFCPMTFCGAVTDAFSNNKNMEFGEVKIEQSIEGVIMDKQLASDAANLIRSLMHDMRISSHITGVIGGKHISSDNVLERLEKVYGDGA